MNRRKKIAMLAGLLGSISLSVVQAEISEKPVANKKYNDYFGHVKGDRCLERVANALTLCLSEGVLIRYGGEEFVYINENITLERLQVIGDELCQAIEQLDLTVPPNVARKCVTVSVGGTTGIIKDEESWLEVLNTADEALYMAKKKGKSKCICK